MEVYLMNGFSRVSVDPDPQSINGFSRMNFTPDAMPVNGLSRVTVNPLEDEMSLNGLTLNGAVTPYLIPSDDGGFDFVYVDESMNGITLNGDWMPEEEYDLYVEMVEADIDEAAMQGLKSWWKKRKARRQEKREYRKEKKQLKLDKKGARIDKILAKADALQEGGTFMQNLAGTASRMINSVTGEVMDVDAGEIIGDVAMDESDMLDRGLFDRPFYKKKFKNWPTGYKIGAGALAALGIFAGLKAGGVIKPRKKRRR